MKTWPAKDPQEKIWLTFNYQQALESGETIVSAAITVTVISGTDGSPASILAQPASILTGRVMQQIRNGIDGVSYQLRCAATTSNDRILVAAGVLPVRDFA